MRRAGFALATASCALVLTTTACGTSHNESNAQVCAKLKTDAQSLQNDNPGSNAKAAATDIKNVTKKLNDDASHAKSSQLRDAVTKATDAFDKLASDLSTSSTSAAGDISNLESQLQGAGKELSAACPGQ